MIKQIELAPIKETTKSYDELEERIKSLFRKLLYLPLARELGVDRRDVLSNARGKDPNPLLTALRAGTVTFSRGTFRGKFDAGVSKALKDLGAEWDKKAATFRLPLKEIPYELRQAISASEAKFLEKLKTVDEKLRKSLPEEIAGSLKAADLFDSSLWRIDRHLRSTLKTLTVLPDLSPETAKRIADEWQGNMELWIKDFAEEEITRLRAQVKAAILSGNRYGSLVKTIRDSYGVTERKSRFLARQETSLLMTKFKESRYTEAGVTQYRWTCVAGSKGHPVRPSHKILDGKVFSWDDPPITTPPGEPVRRNNPGQDFNCRCFAKPIVKFREQTG